MFSRVDSNTGHFKILPLPADLFLDPSPFGDGALLFLKKFDNNSAALLPAHSQGILLAAGQALATFGQNSRPALEAYGITDRSGSDALNKSLSTKRAQNALDAMIAAMSLSSDRITFANGLGERFADEYFQIKDDRSDPSFRNENFRGVALYIWQSLSTAQETGLRLNVAFAAPPTGGGPGRKNFLSFLHLGRIRALPRSPFSP
jgi:hypothetical protein